MWSWEGLRSGGRFSGVLIDDCRTGGRLEGWSSSLSETYGSLISLSGAWTRVVIARVGVCGRDNLDCCSCSGVSSARTRKISGAAGNL